MTEDERVGQNVVVLRGDRSQKEVAEAMRARGWKWSQATVWSVEKGERPLRLVEAADLAEVLDVGHGPMTFMRSTPGAYAQVQARRIFEASETLREAMRNYDELRATLAVLGDDAYDELDNMTLDMIEHWSGRGISAQVDEYRIDQQVEAIASAAEAEAYGAGGVQAEPRGRFLTMYTKAK